MLTKYHMDLEVFKSEILELLKTARTHKAAEKLLAACKEGTYNYRTIEECLKRIHKLEEERMSFSKLSYSEYSRNWAKIDHALIWVVSELSPDELESNQGSMPFI